MNTGNDAVLAEGNVGPDQQPARFDGVTTIGVDEDVLRHTRRGYKCVTVIIELTGPRTGNRPARLLDMIEARLHAGPPTLTEPSQ